ncbi:unnamed protein product, partial [Mesorhabditis spiculigera]
MGESTTHCQDEKEYCYNISVRGLVIFDVVKGGSSDPIPVPVNVFSSPDSPVECEVCQAFQAQADEAAAEAELPEFERLEQCIQNCSTRTLLRQKTLPKSPTSPDFGAGRREDVDASKLNASALVKRQTVSDFRAKMGPAAAMSSDCRAERLGNVGTTNRATPKPTKSQTVPDLEPKKLPKSPATRDFSAERFEDVDHANLATPKLVKSQTVPDLEPKNAALPPRVPTRRPPTATVTPKKLEKCQTMPNLQSTTAESTKGPMLREKTDPASGVAQKNHEKSGTLPKSASERQIHLEKAAPKRAVTPVPSGAPRKNSLRPDRPEKWPKTSRIAGLAAVKRKEEPMKVVKTVEPPTTECTHRRPLYREACIDISTEEETFKPVKGRGMPVKVFSTSTAKPTVVDLGCAEDFELYARLVMPTLRPKQILMEDLSEEFLLILVRAITSCGWAGIDHVEVKDTWKTMSPLTRAKVLAATRSRRMSIRAADEVVNRREWDVGPLVGWASPQSYSKHAYSVL